MLAGVQAYTEFCRMVLDKPPESFNESLHHWGQRHGPVSIPPPSPPHRPSPPPRLLPHRLGPSGNAVASARPGLCSVPQADDGFKRNCTSSRLVHEQINTWSGMARRRLLLLGRCMSNWIGELLLPGRVQPGSQPLPWPKRGI